MFRIGEFSKISGLTVKALRFYHEQGLLAPSYVEPGTGYRFYAAEKAETARVIGALRELDFSVPEIREILEQHDDDASLLAHLETRKGAIEERMRGDRQRVTRLAQIIRHEREAQQAMAQTAYEVEEKTVPAQRAACLEMRGKYSDCGQGFAKIGRAFGRYVNGKPLMLCHDGEYRADDAHFEVAMPVRKGEDKGEIQIRELPGGRCLSLLHLGPYDELSRSYEKILRFADEQGHAFLLPTREIYLKGPGMIFRGNPKKYLTEIQFMLESPDA